MKRLTLLRSILVCGVAVAVIPAFAQPKTEINISYVPQPFNLQSMVMKDRGMLEKEFEKDGIAIKWHNLNTGPKQTKAMAAGSLDVSPIMNAAATLTANSEGNPVFIVGGTAQPTKMYALIGKPGTELQIKDLKGKTIVGPKGTFLHQFLVAALEKNGMTINDVNFVNMDIPKSLAAVIAGKADAGLVAASALIKGNASGAKTIATAEGYASPTLFVTASGKFAKEHPELLKRVMKVDREALEWIQAHPEEAVALGSKEHQIPVEKGKTLAEWSNFFTTLTPENVKELEADEAFLLKNGMIRNHVNVQDIILPIAFEK